MLPTGQVVLHQGIDGGLMDQHAFHQLGVVAGQEAGDGTAAAAADDLCLLTGGKTLQHEGGIVALIDEVVLAALTRRVGAADTAAETVTVIGDDAEVFGKTGAQIIEELAVHSGTVDQQERTSLSDGAAKEAAAVSAAELMFLPLHYFFRPAARTAEMTMLPFSSDTGAPREQSHTILRKPCSMGP